MSTRRQTRFSQFKKQGMYNEWSETKKQFRTGLIASTIIVFAFLVWPGNTINTSERNHIKETVVLDSKPIFDKEYHGKSGTEYFVRLKFKGDNSEYRIDGIDYNFLRNIDLNEINIGDTLNISRTSKSIHSIIKNNFDYMNYEKAETNRGLVIYFIGYLFIPMIPLCLVVQFFKKRPSLAFNGKSCDIPFDIITILIFISTFIILINVMPDFQIITNGKFYK